MKELEKIKVVEGKLAKFNEYPIERTYGSDVTSNDVLDALIKLNASIPATASEIDGFMMMRFTIAEFDELVNASINAIRVIKENRQLTSG